MKTSDYWFRGFPALWNVVALYLFVLRPPGVVCAGLLISGRRAMFAPIVFVHPLRVKKCAIGHDRGLRVFFALAAVAILAGPARGGWVKAGFLAVAAYFLALPFLRHSPWAGRSTWEIAPCSTGLKLAIASAPGRTPLRLASWRSGYAEDCKSLHPGSIPGEASITN